jgi:hypothetical protein
MATQTVFSPIDEGNYFLGIIYENYVAQALVQNGYPLYYWKNNNTAELDFLIQLENKIIPIEVKKGNRVKSTSFNIFMNTYKNEYGIRISAKNFGFENKIRSVPLYAVWLL